MSTYGFSAGDAKRIGRAVRLSERDEPRHELVGTRESEVSRGVRLLIGQHASSTGWATGSTAIVTIYNGDPVASVITVVAKNQFLKFSTNTSCTQRWVAIGHNGWGWQAVSQERVCTNTCTMEVSGIDFSSLPGFDGTKIQLLGHNNGQTAATGTDPYCSAVASLRWFDITTCSTAA